MFDVIAFLEDNDIEYKNSGKNVTMGWVEVTCPFCFDPSFHLGWNLKSTLFHCWRCGEKGNSIFLIKEMLDTSFNNARKVYSKYSNDDLLEEQEEQILNEKLEFPKECTNVFPYLHQDYLLKRGFDPKVIRDKYMVRACYQIGFFSYRLVVPVYMNGILVNMLGRDVTGESPKKYLNLPNEQSVIPMKNCLYNIDSVKKEVVIVEGVFDVWRMGDGFVATLGVEYTTQQLNLLLEKEPSKAFVLFDPDAIRKADKLASTLASFIPKVEILSIDKKDPAELTAEEASDLRKEIGM